MFRTALQEEADAIPPAAVWVLCGDMNARVGRRRDGQDLAEVIGPFGVGARGGRRSENGEHLLGFCAQNELTVLGTYYDLPEDRMVSGRHPRWRIPAVLDHAVMRQRDRVYVCQVCAIPQAEVDSDHVLMRLTLRPRPGRLHGPARAPEQELPMEVEKPLPRIRVNCAAELDPEGEGSREEAFVERVLTRIRESVDSPTLESLTQTLRGEAEVAFGVGRNPPPSWRDAPENQGRLRDMAQRRQAAHEAFRSAPGPAAARGGREARRAGRVDVDRMVNSWWLEQANLLRHHTRRRDQRSFYAKIRDLQALVGTPPSRKVQQGGLVEHHAKLREHFHRVLNIDRGVAPGVVDAMEDLVPAELLLGLDWSDPSPREVYVAIMDMNNNKAPDSTGLVAELVKFMRNELDFMIPFCAEIVRLWNGERRCPEDWHEDRLVALWKGKGAMADLDNWRGVALLAIMGKILGKVVNARLRKLVERVVSESHCGFRRHRGCPDATFVLR